MTNLSAMRVEILIEDVAARHPQRTALIFAGRQWTYGVLHAEMERRAAMLVNTGLAPGDSVATTEAVSDEMAITFLACCRADLTFLPLSPQWTAAEITPLIERARPKMMLTAHGTLHPAVPMIPAMAMALPGDPSDSAMRETMQRSIEGLADRAAIIQTTSGTTGSLPKLAMIPHRLLTWRAPSSRPSWWMDAESVLYTPSANLLPVRDYCEVLSHGGTMVFSQTAQPDTIEAELAMYHVTILATVPTILQLLAERPDAPAANIALRTVRFSAAPLPAATWRGIEARYGATIVQEYASTEGGWMIGTPRTGAPIGSIGVPLPDIAVRIVDEDGADVPSGAVGELVVRSPVQMCGYLGNPEATARTIRDGWLWTGDRARQDVDGFYYLEGRTALRINVGGRKVAPEEVEDVLVQHPGVREVVVLAMPDVARGEAVRAIIVPAAEPPSTGDLRRFCHERLATYKVPRRFEFRDTLPRSPLGKVLRHQL